MNKRRIAVILSAVAGFLFVLGWFLVTNPPPPPARSIIFEIVPLPSSNGVSRRCAIVVSNASDYSVEYAEGFNKLWVTVAYVSNGVWQTYQVRTPGGGAFFLDPHAVIKDTITVPEAATVFKVGLHFTSLTWRSEFAIRISGYGKYLKSAAGFLLVQDERERSRIEWSDEQIAAHLWNRN